jgi:hypothetical protein
MMNFQRNGFCPKMRGKCIGPAKEWNALLFFFYEIKNFTVIFNSCTDKLHPYLWAMMRKFGQVPCRADVVPMLWNCSNCGIAYSCRVFPYIHASFFLNVQAKAALP